MGDHWDYAREVAEERRKLWRKRLTVAGDILLGLSVAAAAVMLFGGCISGADVKKLVDDVRSSPGLPEALGLIGPWGAVVRVGLDLTAAALALFYSGKAAKKATPHVVRGTKAAYRKVRGVKAAEAPKA
mgnify:CR=1 FL=1